MTTTTKLLYATIVLIVVLLAVYLFYSGGAAKLMCLFKKGPGCQDKAGFCGAPAAPDAAAEHLALREFAGRHPPTFSSTAIGSQCYDASPEAIAESHAMHAVNGAHV